jgi:hypothetical protein
MPIQRTLSGHLQQPSTASGTTATVNRISEYTNTPLAFVQFLWRVKTHIDGCSITETYCWIKKRSWVGTPDNTYLEPAYRVFHPWTGSEWIMTSISNLL